jgi:hypothetical protein
MRFRNESAGGMPTTVSSGKIESSRGNTFALPDASAQDSGALLPKLARDRLRALQRRHDDARDLLHTLTDRTIAAQQDRAHAAAVVQQRQGYGRGYVANAALEHAKAELARAEQKLREVDDAIADLKQRAEQAKAVRAPIGAILRAIDDGITTILRSIDDDDVAAFARKARAKIKDHGPVVPKLRKGETNADAVVRLREELARLEAKRRSIECAPLPFAEAKAIAHQQLAELAERGRPNCYQLAEAGLPIQFAMTPLRVDLTGAFAMPAGDQAGHGLAGFGHGETADVLALMTWVHRDALTRAIDEELKACCSEGEPLTRGERTKRLVEIDAERLALEREEVAVIETDDFRIPFRPDTDWRAVLCIEVPATRSEQ